jgi:hypothetical protein
MRELMLDIFRWLHNTPYPIAEADKKKAEFWRRLWDEMGDYILYNGHHKALYREGVR